MGWRPYGCTSCEDRWSAWGRRRPLALVLGRAPQECLGRCRYWHRHLGPLPQWCRQHAPSCSPHSALALLRKCSPAAQDTPRSSWQASWDLKKQRKLRRGLQAHNDFDKGKMCNVLLINIVLLQVNVDWNIQYKRVWKETGPRICKNSHRPSYHQLTDM